MRPKETFCPPRGPHPCALFAPVVPLPRRVPTVPSIAGSSSQQGMTCGPATAYAVGHARRLTGTSKHENDPHPNSPLPSPRGEGRREKG